MPIKDHSHWVEVLRAGVAEMHRQFAADGEFDGHDLINWMNTNHNEVLNEIVTSYVPAEDEVFIATRQIGKFLQDWMGQQKIGERPSKRSIRLSDGSTRDGECSVSVWLISPDTSPGNRNDRSGRLV